MIWRSDTRKSKPAKAGDLAVECHALKRCTPDRGPANDFALQNRARSPKHKVCQAKTSFGARPLYDKIHPIVFRTSARTLGDLKHKDSPAICSTNWGETIKEKQ